ncbi:MAG: carbohydrate ABC transporter permease [Hyphomicrobiales bacterium]
MTDTNTTGLLNHLAPDERVFKNYPKKRKKIKGSSIATFAFLSIIAIAVLIPLYVIVVTSFKTLDQIALGQIFDLPTTWNFSGWYKAWFEVCSGMTCEGVKAGFFTSIKILIPSILISVGLASVTGYALALWNIKWANSFLFVLFICAFVPFQIIMIPLVVLTAKMGIFGSIWAVAIVHGVLSMPFLTLIFRNFYKDIPPELINAALMDSGSFWRIFGEIILPMSGNIIIVVLILVVTGVWNDFLIGLTFGGIGTQPMTVILANTVITGTGAVRYNVDMAAALLTAIPPLVVYFGLGKFFVQGISAGAIKG